ncbi:hypothetical protein ACSTQ1_006228 [Pseudomonas aeruginosa]|uniref:hypothetical protein n=1 Tax=Pseudomonas aeruginosa TaxID=287 RepID=UPI003748F328
MSIRYAAGGDPRHQVLGAAGGDGHLLDVIEVDALHQVLEVLGAGGHPLYVIEVGRLRQLLAGRAGRIRSTRSSAPPTS